LGRGTIANILRENGIDPAPERDQHTRWSTFLKAHWECVTAADFLSVEVFTIKGFVTQYVLFFIDIASRSVHVAGITPDPVAEINCCDLSQEWAIPSEPSNGVNAWEEC
jgi:putative transposase